MFSESLYKKQEVLYKLFWIFFVLREKVADTPRKEMTRVVINPYRKSRILLLNA